MSPSAIRYFYILALLLACPSCRTAKSVVAAVEVKPSSFLTHAKELKEARDRSPFLGNWWNYDPKVVTAAEQEKKIHIAPVLYSNIRPLEGVLAKVEYGSKRRDRNLPELARYTRKKFIQAFKKSKAPRYTVVDVPDKETLILELSLLKWMPNTISGFVVREAVDMVTFDGVAMLTLKGLRGIIAIEGRLIEPKSRQPVFEFADKEMGKTVILMPLQEFYPTGQARFAINEWARQLEQLMRTKSDVKVKDSFPVVLWNF